MRFPKIVALTAFILYALTLSRGMTLNSMGLAAKIAGWDWLPMTNRPLTWLLTLPLHLLPAGWIPVALNLFSAAMAALTLGLLARCVQLFPWDCPPDTQKPWAAKLPALLAVAVCGLEFSFWQEAVAATGEMTDLLLLALAVWCLLEYRVEKETRWLGAAALVWGLGMAENWLMLATLPLFVAALIALRQMRFFKVNFLLRMALWGLAGFSLYVLLPLVNWLAPHSPYSFAEAWLAALHSTSSVFHTLYFGFWMQHRLLVVAVLLYFLVPALPCFLRLKTQTTINLSKIDRFQVNLFRTLRVALLLACLWLAFDPVIGPREMVRQQLGMALPLLSFDLVNALGIAFLAGNLLFASQVPPRRRSRGPLEKLSSLLRRQTVTLLAGISLVVIAGLAARNLPAIRSFNHQPLSAFGGLLARSLPPGGGIVLGGDLAKLTVLQATLAGGAERRRWQVANLRLLPNPKYRARLERLAPEVWAGTAGDGELKPNQLLQLLDGLARTNRIFFLQPRHGDPLFERFNASPLGAVHELKHYAVRRFDGAALLPKDIASQEQFWDDAWRAGAADLAETDSRPSRAELFLRKHFAIQPARRDQSLQLGHWFSAAFNDWGVALEQAGLAAGAQRRFEQALRLTTNNVAAEVNLNCCTNLLAGKKLPFVGAAQTEEKFRNLRQLEQFISLYGEFDEPGIRCVLGNAWLEAGWPRQAWQEFARAGALAPDAITPQLAQAQIYSRFRFDAEVFETVGRLRPLVTNSPAGQALEVELAMLEAKSWISQTNPAHANRILENLLLAHPESPAFTEMVFKAYLAFGELTNALAITEAQLAKTPDSIAALNNKAALLIQARQAAVAIPVLDRALTLTNLPSIRLNRAIAYLQVTNLAAAEKDYGLLLDAAVDQFSVHYGLGQIALGRGDTNLAVQHFTLCLSNTPNDGPKRREIRARLEALAH
ncbi:MAG: DUF2723 domain-containing protein [Verrucomicrobiae bacterium]|nr:DUF2723 domain-containing protein [Verrucomicrobiae bacterium]